MRKFKKQMNTAKEEYRGTLKQIMKVRGLRTISLNNYMKWKGVQPDPTGVHSLKIDIQSGYLNIYGYGAESEKRGFRCSDTAIEDASATLYRGVYNTVMEILEKENEIPTKVKKNILVSVFR